MTDSEVQESGARGGDELEAALARLDGTPAAYLRAAREVERLGESAGLSPLRVCLVSTFTVDLVLPYLAVEGARRGLRIASTVSPFGQLEQQVLDAGSVLYASRPDVVILAIRVEEAAPRLADDFVALSSIEVGNDIAAHCHRVRALLEGLRERTTARVLVWNQMPPMRLAAGLADASNESSQVSVFAEINRRIAEGCRAVPDTFVFDAARLVGEVGLAAWYDPKLAFLARAPLGAVGQIAVGKSLARALRALTTPPRKCLVLDLDNTLWGGVLGEDGIGGIKLGTDFPGNVFLAFQKQLRSYRDRGVLLAIASKNNDADVVECFEKHPDQVLRLSDFAARQIHWNDKASSIAAIAKALNIGTDSIAFFDDSPVEREWMRSRMPEVAVIDVPTDPLRYAAALDAAELFDTLVLTAEDRERSALYRQDEGRSQLLASSGSVDDFLRALEVRVEIGPIDATTLPRVGQLLGKTNQFNVTTRRHSAADLERMLSEGAIGLWLRARDRFGDNGLVGVAIARQESAGDWIIDSFLLSCRVLGRGVEHALLSAITRKAIERGARRMLGEFIPTAKNAPAAGFFADGGFTPLPQRPGFWHFDLTQGPIPTPTTLELLEHP